MLDRLSAEVRKADTTESKLDKATELRYKIDEVSTYLGEVELRLPKEADSLPQLYEILNKY